MKWQNQLFRKIDRTATYAAEMAILTRLIATISTFSLEQQTEARARSTD